MASEIIEGGGFKIQPLVEGDETGESVSVFHCEMQPGVTTPAPHSHDGFDETVYCLAGKINFVLDGKPRLMEPGDLIHVPRGVVHGFAVAGEEPASSSPSRRPASSTQRTSARWPKSWPLPRAAPPTAQRSPK